MANMIPGVPAPEAPPSERRVYEGFRSELPNTWTVIHSQHFLLPARRGAREEEGELDFLVLDPSRGALGLEVKGGRVQKMRRGWVSVDRDGKEHIVKDPGAQARRAVHGIRRYLDAASGFGGKGFRCRFGWGVVLPDIVSLQDMGPDLPRHLIVDRKDCLDFQTSVDRIFGHWKLPELARTGRHSPALSAAGAEALVATLVERYPPASGLALQFGEETQALLRLTQDQISLLDTLSAHRRAAIEGAAGTGKTVLAMEKARRMATTGARVLLLCFNRPLAAHLARDAEGFTVETFHDFCRRLAQRAKLPFTPRKRSDGDPRFWEKKAPMLLLEALERFPDERYDAIVVDEGQDFLSDWWPCLDEALRDGREGTLYAFYDPNQDIYDGGPPGALEVIEHKLVYNCRNTRKIAKYASDLLDTKALLKPGAPPGLPVEEITCDGDADMVRKVSVRIDQLVTDEGIAPDRIAIVSTRTLKNSPFAKEHRVGRFQLVNLDDRKSWIAQAPLRGGSAKQIVFDTLYRFKGLEREVVILLDLPSSDRVTSHHLYVAASRAKNLLVVVRPSR